LLASLASDLKCAGLDRLNISLDTLDRKVFAKLARRDVLDRVLAGIDAALAAGFRGIRLNALAIRGVTESQILPLVRFAIGKGLHLRFIEYMPLDADANWQRQQVLAGEEIRAIIESQFGPLVAEQRHDDSQPAVDYRLPGGSLVGVIHPVTEPFCAACNRIRLTAEGQIRNCLFSTREWDAREVLRRSGSDEQLASLLRAAIREKKAGHGIDEQDFERPQRAMYQIGG
jgi:cyclic pyranopterin phosphate synthase